MARGDLGHVAAVLGEGALVIEVYRPVIGGLLGQECVGLVWAMGGAECDEAVLGIELGLVDEPVVVVRFLRLCVEQYNCSAHGAWYVEGLAARIRLWPRSRPGAWRSTA